MRKFAVLAILLAGVFFACRQTESVLSSLLNSSNLPSSFFSVDITRDTVLLTRKGATLKIAAGSLLSTEKIVKLVIKEAYSITDIIKGGLSTQSNGQPLSSGGMIYIDVVPGQNVTIAKPIAVATPTSFIDPAMQLFKGEIKPDSSINWVEPKAIAETAQTKALNNGKMLFENNCASCHAIDKDLTGPALAHVVKRSPEELILSDTSYPHNTLYDFTRNNQDVLQGESRASLYYRCLYNTWNKTPMNSFPNLTDRDLDNLYGYIENESERLNLPVRENVLLSCVDSCLNYLQLAGDFERIKKQLEKDSVNMVNEIMEFAPTPKVEFAEPDTLPAPVIWPETVNPMNNKSLYYQFNVESFGWYNVDILLKEREGVETSKLIVRVEGEYKARFNVYLVIPSVKALMPGGPLKDAKNMYGFYGVNGSIPLPQGATAYILAFGEFEDKIIFAKEKFTVSREQDISINLEVVTASFFNNEILKMGLEDLKISVNSAPNADTLRKVIRQLKSAEGLKPKNCNCDCFIDLRPQPGAESTDYLSPK